MKIILEFTDDKKLLIKELPGNLSYDVNEIVLDVGKCKVKIELPRE
jgi:hypothetical protein